MKTLSMRILAAFICLILPCAALAESVPAGDAVVHADFTLELSLHADGFPPVDAHLKAWETFLQKLSLNGSLDGTRFWHEDSRVLMNAALCINGEETVPFTYDERGSVRYFISPALRSDSLMFQMHNYFEFMLKPFFYLGLPTNYIAVFTYPDAAVYVLESLYAPLDTMIAEARAEAKEAAGNESGEALTYTVPFEQLLAVCGELNAVTADDKSLKRVQRFLDVLLAELYLSDVVADGLKQTESMLYLLDPDMQGMTVTETEDGMVCSFGETEVFSKTTAGNVTALSVRFPISQTDEISLSWRWEEQADAAALSAAMNVAREDAILLALSVEGEGLPAEGALEGEGYVTVSMGGSEFYEVPAPQTINFLWSRTAAELPYALEMTADWLHPDTGLPALSLSATAAFAQSEVTFAKDKHYKWEDFFGLNPEKLTKYKEELLPTFGAHLLPVVLEMPFGVIDDIVDFLLETDILLTITD